MFKVPKKELRDAGYYLNSTDGLSIKYADSHGLAASSSKLIFLLTKYNGMYVPRLSEKNFFKYAYLFFNIIFFYINILY